MRFPYLGGTCNCIQNFHLGRYIVGYTVENLVLRRRASGDVKRDFQTYIWRYTSPNVNFEYGYHHSNAFLQFRLELERCKPHKAARHLTICDVINDVKLFPTVYHRIYCRKFLTLSNQTSRYKCKCIRIVYIWLYPLKNSTREAPSSWLVCKQCSAAETSQNIEVLQVRYLYLSESD